VSFLSLKRWQLETTKLTVSIFIASCQSQIDAGDFLSFFIKCKAFFEWFLQSELAGWRMHARQF